MGFKLFFVLGLIQLSSVLAIGLDSFIGFQKHENKESETIQSTPEQRHWPIPLKCFLQDFNIFGPLGKTSCSEASNSLNFGNVIVDSSSFDINGWLHEAKNVKYEGLDDAVLDDFGLNFTSQVLELAFHTDMVIKYDYKSSGILFSLPVNGAGFAEVALKNIQVGYKFPFEIEEADGKIFIELKSFDYWYNIKDKADFKFTSLTNKSKALGDEVYQLMNQKWRYIVTNYGKNFFDDLSQKLFSVFKDYVKTLPIKDFAKC